MTDDEDKSEEDIDAESERDALTQWISKSRAGDDKAQEAVFEFAYAKLKHIARKARGGWPQDGTLDTTSLVHEFFLKFSKSSGQGIESRGHFFHLAARMMRQIIINHAKHKMALKRGGDVPKLSMTDEMIVDVESPEDLLIVDQILTNLEAENESAANVFICKRYARLTNQETAQALDISVSTVKRHLAYANAYLTRQLLDQD